VRRLVVVFVVSVLSLAAAAASLGPDVLARVSGLSDGGFW